MSSAGGFFSGRGLPVIPLSPITLKTYQSPWAPPSLNNSVESFITDSFKALLKNEILEYFTLATDVEKTSQSVDGADSETVVFRGHRIKKNALMKRSLDLLDDRLNLKHNVLYSEPQSLTQSLTFTCPGPAGPKGFNGQKGFKGDMGEQGSGGNIGTPGTNGVNGMNAACPTGYVPV